MREAVIVGAARTPCCKRGAQLAPLVAEEIASFAIKAAIERAGVDPAEIEEVCRAADGVPAVLPSYACDDGGAGGRPPLLRADADL